MTEPYKKLLECRIGGGPNLLPVLNLGVQAMTGVFPETMDQPTASGPLELVRCPESGLVQLGHSFEPGEMFGANYGYRSGLNASMVKHLTDKVEWLERQVNLQSGDIVLDIGSNDATTLKAYRTPALRRVGIDPTGQKFSPYYTDGIELVADFFSAEAFRRVIPEGRAKVVTSISMFYDLEDPISFARQVASVLAEDGVWHLEQSYLPAMMQANSYDTICHEHLEYYTFGTISTILEAAGLAVTDVSFNNVNGGSFAVTAASAESSRSADQDQINDVIEAESSMGLATEGPYREFAKRVFQHRNDLRELICELNADGKKVLGYGASTKGNVLLQFCGFTSHDIPAIAEVNPDKFGRFTPGSKIPIVSEQQARAMGPDYFLVLPWHFKENILSREREFLSSGGRFIFPLPEITII